jgi:SRSO17 transposase
VAVPKAGPAPLPELAAYLAPFAPLFRRAQSRQSLERYVTGLLTDQPRKNCDTIAAAVAGTSTERLQHLLTDADWAPEALDEARVRQLVALSPPGGVLVVDDTGLPKKGSGSVGVAPQYSGTLGKVANCQVVVTAEYVEDAPETSTPLHWPVSARLFLPEAWATDPGRRRRARVPAEVTHQPKSQLGLALVDRARAWGVPFAFVAADAGYGQTLRQLDGYEASRRRMLETLSNGRHLLLRDSNDSPLIEGLVRDGNLQTVGFTRTGTEYAITPAGKEYVSGGP